MSWASVACNSSASVQGLVDSTSIRWAINKADSRNTWARCARSSMCLTRSASARRKPARGSRDSGAPALAVSRAQAMASATFNRLVASKARAFSAHSSARVSWVLARRSSSIFSFTGLAAPLSRALNSLKTVCSTSSAGSVFNHSRTRVKRSPEVAAVNAPPVMASRAVRSGELWVGEFTAFNSLICTRSG